MAITTICCIWLEHSLMFTLHHGTLPKKINVILNNHLVFAEDTGNKNKILQAIKYD